MKLCPICQRNNDENTSECPRCGYDLRPAPPPPIYRQLEPQPMTRKQQIALMWLPITFLVVPTIFIMAMIISLFMGNTTKDTGLGIFVILVLQMIATLLLGYNRWQDLRLGVVYHALDYLDRWMPELSRSDPYQRFNFHHVGTLQKIYGFGALFRAYNGHRLYRITYSPHSKRLWTIEPYNEM